MLHQGSGRARHLDRTTEEYKQTQTTEGPEETSGNQTPTERKSGNLATADERLKETEPMLVENSLTINWAEEGLSRVLFF